ncbi:MAG: response regulator [Planctomycetota bacterium]|nr:response regulator [Planctomycetota bacterium]
MRIMLVDDSRTMRQHQREILRQAGHEDIDEASSGADALSKVASCPPQLIILSGDLAPDMDAITFVRTYRERGRKTPIIMVSSTAERSSVLEAIEAGVNHYIVKPFTPETLSERVADMLTRFEAA